MLPFAAFFALTALVALAAIALTPMPAHAHDGAIAWRTLHAPRVAVHYPAGYEALARRVAWLAEDALDTFATLLPYRPPRRVEISIDDYADGANGFAINFPYDHVHLLAAPPRVGSDLEGNGDWLRALVFHELSHVLHMGYAEQVPAWVNAVIGRVYLPNTQLPRFWLEGLATWVETRYPGGTAGSGGDGNGTGVRAGSPPPRLPRAGRVEGAIFMARLRAAALDDQWPSLEVLTGSPLRWPRGRGWYVFGSWLHDVQARRYGPERTTAFIHAYGRRVLPYAINTLYRQIYGRSAVAIWREAEAELRARLRAEAALRAQGLVPPGLAGEVTRSAAALADAASPTTAVSPASPPPRRLSFDGEGRGRVRAHPDGRSLLYARAAADDLAVIERFWPHDGRRQVVHRCELDCDDVVVTPDAAWLLFVGSRPRALVYRPNEVVAAPLRGGVVAGPARALGAGWRARELAVARDGSALAYARLVRGRTELRVLALDAALRGYAGSDAAIGARVAVAADAAEIVGTPAFVARDLLAYTAGRGCRRDVLIPRLGPDLAPRGAPTRLGLLPAASLRTVTTRGVGGVAHVGWAGDLSVAVVGGRVLLGAIVEPGGVDAAGRFVPGTYRDAATLDLGAADSSAPLGAVAPAAGLRWQVATTSATSLTSATWLGDGGVIGVEVRGNGLDLVAAAAPSPAAPAPPEPFRPPPPPAPAPASPAVALRQSAYDFWPTMRPFRWVPVVEAGAVGAPVSPLALVAGFDLSGHDPLELYRWTATLRSDLAFERPLAVLGWTTSRFRPTWSASAAWLPGTAWTSRGFVLHGFATRSLALRLGGALALPSVRGGFALEGALRLGRTWLADDAERFRLRVLPDEPFGPTPYRLDLPAAGEIAAGLSYQRAESYPNSITAERLTAVTVAATFTDPLLGDDGRALRLDLRGRRSVPLGGHRVLALRGRVGHAVYVERGHVPYRVEGLGPTDLSGLLYGPGGSDFGAVRGLSEARSGGRRLAGRSLGWASAELYLPLRDVGRGFDTLPLWLGRLWAVVFCDGAGVLAGDEARLRDRQTTSGVAGSAGIELRLGLELGYLPFGTLRLGAAAVRGDAEDDGGVGAAGWIRLGN